MSRQDFLPTNRRTYAFPDVTRNGTEKIEKSKVFPFSMLFWKAANRVKKCTGNQMENSRHKS